MRPGYVFVVSYILLLLVLIFQYAKDQISKNTAKASGATVVHITEERSVDLVLKTA